MNDHYCKDPFFAQKNTASELVSAECSCCSQNNLIKSSLREFPIGKFMRFLRHIKLHRLLKTITDRRDPRKTRYRLDFLLQWALSVFFFRAESLNDLQDSFDKVSLDRRKSLWDFFGLPEGSPLPHRQTVTDSLALVDPEEINAMLIQLFRWAIKYKVFYNHTHVLGDTFGLACDGFVVHHYNHPHSINEKGENLCPYCLPRTSNKNTPNERTYWLHTFVNLAVILPGGIQLPLYIYPLKAEQLKGQEDCSDEHHKQECELQAAKEILPLILKQFSRLPFVLLTDSLYANEPLIELCRELKLQFLIVRQEGSLKKLAKRCDALEKVGLYACYRSQQTRILKNGGKIVTTVNWFNGEYVGAQEVHVIRFLEVEYNAQGEQIKSYKTEWLSSQKVSKRNCFNLIKTARQRADHEDLHNTLKNRGFNGMHDYARSNANAALVWKLLMFVAFWIFELFSCSIAAQESRGKTSWKKFAKELLTDLVRESWEEINSSGWLCKEKVQFRWNFSAH